MKSEAEILLERATARLLEAARVLGVPAPSPTSPTVIDHVTASRDNAKFKLLKTLAEDSREPRKQARALLDGIHLVQAALARGADVQQLIISESAQSHPEILALRMRHRALDCLVLRDSLYREISPLTASVGLSATVAIPTLAPIDLSKGAVILDAVQDAGNVGAILRTAAAASISSVVLGHGCAGAWTPRVLRAGQGAHFSLMIYEQAELEALLSTSTATSIATVVGSTTSIYQIDLCQPVIWLFGNEGAGLAPALAQLATHRATIPLDATTESLNVGAAAAICLFEAVRQRRTA